MTLRRAYLQDLPFIVALEQQFRGLNLAGADDRPTHEPRMHDVMCILEDEYWNACLLPLFRDARVWQTRRQLDPVSVRVPGRAVRQYFWQFVLESKNSDGKWTNFAMFSHDIHRFLTKA
jgi:hypothetical protein